MKQKKWIKIGIVLIAIFVISFSDCSFAAVTVEGEFGTLPRFLNFLISIVSWLWIVLAKVAGEFLTNKWVYGEVLGIDVLLRQYRNIVKNMANFCLGFYLVYVIFKGLIGEYGGKEKVIENLKNMLLRVLIAGIGIQASWFLTSVVVDVSTIVLSAVGSLPAQIISESKDLEDAALKSRDVVFGDGAKIYDLFPEDAAANSFSKVVHVGVNNNLSKEEYLDEILPKKDSVSGPLYYMGWSILRTNEINSIDDTNLKKSLINMIIQGGTTIVYSIEIAVLCILALMRILYLWMFIVLSPLAILFACLQQSKEKDLLSKGFVGNLMKQINLKTFFLKVFQPSLVVLGISICLIFVTLINKVVNSDLTKSMEDFDIGGAKITNVCSDNSSTSDDKSCDTKLDGNLLKLSISNIGKGFLDFMMAIITVVLVYLVIQMAIKMGGGDDFVSKGINKLQDDITGAMTSIPIIPVPGHDKQGVATTKAVSLSGLKSIPQQKLGLMTQNKEAITSSQVDSLIEKWGIRGENSLTQSEKTAISAAGTSDGSTGLKILESKKKTIVKTEQGKGMILNPNALDLYWIGEFTNWLNTVNKSDLSGEPKWQNMVKDWINLDPNDKNNRSLKALFDKPGHANTYAEFFGYTSGTYTNFDSIKNLDISKS